MPGTMVHLIKLAVGIRDIDHYDSSAQLVLVAFRSFGALELLKRHALAVVAGSKFQQRLGHGGQLARSIPGRISAGVEFSPKRPIIPDSGMEAVP